LSDKRWTPYPAPLRGAIRNLFITILSMTISSDYLNDVLFNDARHMVEELQFLTNDYLQDLLPRSSKEDAEFNYEDQGPSYYE